MSTEQRPTVYVETYGCQMNVSDSELMLGKLASAGYAPVDQPDGADVILVNTCAIRDHAEQRVIGRLGELKRHMKADTVMGVTGCMAQRLGPQLLEKARQSVSVRPPQGAGVIWTPARRCTSVYHLAAAPRRRHGFLDTLLASGLSLW